MPRCNFVQPLRVPRFPYCVWRDSMHYVRASGKNSQNLGLPSVFPEELCRSKVYAFAIFYDDDLNQAETDS